MVRSLTHTLPPFLHHLPPFSLLPLSLSLPSFLTLSIPPPLRYFAVTLQRITPPTLDDSNYECALKISHQSPRSSSNTHGMIGGGQGSFGMGGGHGYGY
jgi:hypothetical protein